MLVKEIKPIGKVGKNLLENKDADTIIETIIEKPLQKACKQFKNKNIETSMSSANKNNVLKKNEKRVNKVDVIEKRKTSKWQTFLRAGKGYAWIMLNYNTLSDENREVLFNIEEELGEDSVWFVQSNYTEFMNSVRKPFKLKPLVEEYHDKYAEKFKEKEVIIMYNNKYPRRSAFIRMPIDENTKVEDVENYFDEITSKFKVQ